ncbi:hypothetical protein QTP88_005110 [Uroleucon formosanum]
MNTTVETKCSGQESLHYIHLPPTKLTPFCLHFLFVLLFVCICGAYIFDEIKVARKVCRRSFRSLVLFAPPHNIFQHPSTALSTYFRIACILGKGTRVFFNGTEQYLTAILFYEIPLLYIGTRHAYIIVIDMHCVAVYTSIEY